MKVFTHKDVNYNFSPLDVIEKDNKRYYGKDGVYYPSITTVLSEFPGKKEGLEKWRKKEGLEKANSITYVAGQRGTKVHDVAEMYLNNEIQDNKNFFIFKRPPINPDVASMFFTLQPYLNEIDNIDGLEIALYSDQYKMAGRVDCIGEFQGIPSIIDFKTARRMKKTDWIEDYFCQATGYSLMWEEMTGININTIVVLMVSRKDDVSYEAKAWIRNRDDYIKLLMETREIFKELHEPG